jgi:hypothetical protein
MAVYPSAHGVRRPGPSAPTRASRATVLFVAGFMAYWPIALAGDSAGGGLGVQAVIGALTWLLLAGAIWHAPAGLRTPALAMVVVATAFECLGSLIWCAYRYRYHNLPLYVPPGHGLFYLAALRLSLLPTLRRHGPAIVAAIGLASAGWVLHGLLMGPRADVVGALCWLMLVLFLRRGRDPLLLTVTFGLTMVLEFYGTALGTWHWATVFPNTGLPAGNPPSAIGAGYCVLDALAMRLAGHFSH